MLFDVYGTNAPFQWLGWVLVFVGLILANEFARRSKVGGLIMFGALPIAMTVYCVAIGIGVTQGAEWALNNPTHVYQNSWFHYAKVYAALAGCLGFMVIKYKWGRLGRAHCFTRLAVRHRGHQHPDRGVLRFRECLPLLRARRDHLGHVRGRHAATPDGTTCSTASPASSISSA